MANTPDTPVWVDLASPDPAASRSFYSALLGWTPVVDPDERTGPYTNFQLEGRNVAGLGPTMSPDQPAAWTTYVGATDADEIAAKVDKFGGTVLTAPMAVMDYGRLAVFADPSGAVFGVWQAGAHQGAELFNQPGTVVWNELMTHEPDAAKQFYAKVFGWHASDTPMDATDYTTWTLGEDQPVGGMFPMSGTEQTPAHWLVYFAVADADATTAKARELGGAVSAEPADSPPGRFALLGDPHGARFAVIAMNTDYQGPV